MTYEAVQVIGFIERGAGCRTFGKILGTALHELKAYAESIS